VAAQDKVVMAFPGAQSELDRILEVILKELEAGEQQLQGTGLLYQLFAVWLTFFRHLKEHRSTVEIRRGLDDVGLTYLEYASNLGVQPLNYPTLEQLIAFAQQLQNAEQRLESLADLEARAFGAETALSQRIIENGELREQLDAPSAKVRAGRVDPEHDVEPLGFLVDRREALVSEDVAPVRRQHPAHVAELADGAPQLLRRGLRVLDR